MLKFKWPFLTICASMFGIMSCDKESGIISNPDQALPEGRVLNESWYVDHFVDEYDETYLFEGITFEFETNGSVSALVNNQTVNGVWRSRGQSGFYEFNLNFGDHPLLSELNDDDWIIMVMNDSVIELRDDDEHLIFKKGKAAVNHHSAVADSAIIGLWSVVEFLDDNRYDETYEWSGVWVNFKANEIQLLNAQGQVLNSGTWLTRISGPQALLVMNVNGSELADELNETWQYVIKPNGDLELLEHRDGEPDKMKLQRSELPSHGHSTAVDSSIMGNWFVQSFLEEGRYNETQYWAGLTLGFDASGLIITNSQGATVASGSWQTIASGAIALVRIQVQGPYNMRELNEVWQLRVLNQNQIELKEHDENWPDVFVLSKR